MLRTVRLTRRGARSRTSLRVVVVVVFLLSTIFPTSASADAEIGRRTNDGGTTVDGIYSEITPNFFGPIPSGCILFDVVSSGFTGQVEAGVARCGSAAVLDGGCGTRNSNIARYVETFDGANYRCYYAGRGAATFTSRYEARQTDNNVGYAGLVEGNPYGGVAIADPEIKIWGEHTRSGPTDCTGWSGDVKFRNTQYYHRGDGYYYFSTFPSSNIYIGQMGTFLSDCWSFGAYSGADGSAHIFRQAA